MVNLKTLETFINENLDVIDNEYSNSFDDENEEIDNFDDYNDSDEFNNEDELDEALRRTAKQKQTGSEIGQLMRLLNSNEKYITAKEKFLKVFHMESKRIVRENNLKPRTLKKMTKVKLSLDEL